ncbi:MAG TPA: hypothetical protein PL045_09150 [Chitinophagaceae bacterium]|nr:hypothetical protein [Chitinophagaceae bacterium]
MDKIIEYFKELRRNKIEFTPPIRIKETPHSYVKWIDNIFLIRNQLMVTISTNNDACKKLLSACDDIEINSLTIRLYSLLKQTA